MARRRSRGEQIPHGGVDGSSASLIDTVYAVHRDAISSIQEITEAIQDQHIQIEAAISAIQEQMLPELELDRRISDSAKEVLNISATHPDVRLSVQSQAATVQEGILEEERRKLQTVEGMVKPPDEMVYVYARCEEWDTERGLADCLLRLEVGHEVTFVDEDRTWELMLGSNKASGGGIELPVIVFGRDVWWGVGDNDKGYALAKHLKQVQITLSKVRRGVDDSADGNGNYVDEETGEGSGEAGGAEGDALLHHVKHVKRLVEAPKIPNLPTTLYG